MSNLGSDHKFQVNLSGIIDILSNHLYATPSVFIRELLQNSVDAIRARQLHHVSSVSHFEPVIELTLTRDADGRSVLEFSDNGIGLTKQNIHDFLATIGNSSKSAINAESLGQQDFIGHFGIGLLSCFLVSDEIHLVTQHVNADEPPYEWVGLPDGTYQINPINDALEQPRQPGTKVRLVAKPVAEEYFDFGKIAELVTQYGGLLPFPIWLQQSAAGSAENRQCFTQEALPWTQNQPNSDSWRQDMLALGTEWFDEEFIDCFAIQDETLGCSGVAYLLPKTPSMKRKPKHRVYLKRMLLCDQADNLVPDWAFFVRIVVNTQSLRPTASREAIYSDQALDQHQLRIGELLRDWLLQQARQNPEKLASLVERYRLAIMSLALEDNEIFQAFVHWLAFDTTAGRMTLNQYLKQYQTIRYTPNLDQFRQISKVAAAQDMTIINAGYIYENEILERLAHEYPDIAIEVTDAGSLLHDLQNLNDAEYNQTHHLLLAAEAALQKFQVSITIKRFYPENLPVLFVANDDVNFSRSLTQTKEQLDSSSGESASAWGGVLGAIAPEELNTDSELCLNYSNSLIQRLSQLRDQELLEKSIQMLYVQALLLAHQPLNADEMKLLTTGLTGLISWGLNVAGEPEWARNMNTTSKN